MITTVIPANDGSGRKMVMVGITDEMNAQLEKEGHVLLDSDRSGTGVDILVIRQTDVQAVVDKAKELMPGGEFGVRIIQ